MIKTLVKQNQTGSKQLESSGVKDVGGIEDLCELQAQNVMRNCRSIISCLHLKKT